MPTRKDKTNVAPIYREQVFIPASGATLTKQQARPKIAGRPVSSGAIEIVSPEFDFLTGIRGIYNIASTPINITSKNAIKITDKQWDKAYIKAVKNNDLNEAQRLRDLHFQAKAFDNVVTKDGMPIHNYHGTDTDFNIFNLSYFGKTDAGDRGRGFYFSSNKDIAENYGGIVKDVYLYGKTPYSGTRSSLLNRGRSKAEIITQYNRNFNKNINNDIKLLLEQQKSGNVSLLYKRLNIDKNTTPEQIKNKVIDYYSKRRDNFVKELGNIDEADIYLSDYENVIYDANKIKSAKAIIYDENGELINLSKRDNFNINDIRMKCGGRRKAQLGLDIREGGIAIPIAPNMYYMNGRSHNEGGIGIGPNNKNGLEVEGGEVVKVGDNDIKVFSSVPLLRGVSPAQLVMRGANPNKVFKAQEEFKDKNRINDDGTRYQTGGQKIYTPNESIQRQIQETGRITIGGAPTIGGLRTYGYLRGLSNVRKYGQNVNNLFTKSYNFLNKKLQNLINKNKISVDTAQKYNSAYREFVGETGQNIPKTISLMQDDDIKKAGGIYIKPSKRGTFTAAAKKRGMGVQDFASKVLANKEDYSPAMVKKANFARNASRWKKELGGNMIYTVNGNVKNGLMNARPKAELGIEKNIKYPYRDNNGQYYINNGYKIYSNGQILNEKGYSKYYVNVDKNKNVVGFSLDENGNREIAPSFNESTARKAYNYSKNKRPQYYAEKRLPIAGSQSIAEKAGLARSGWSYADNEPISLNYIPNINLSIPDNYGKTSTPRKGGSKTTTSNSNVAPTKINSPKIDLSKAKMPTFDVSQLGSKESRTYKANTPKSGRWVGQYKSTNIGDWIGLGSNLAGTIASYFMTKNAINKMPDPIKPVMAQAAKLKTRYNVEPQLTSIREAEQMNRAAVRRNTQSSNTSLAREQRLMNEARGARNVLYGQKENIETQLINQDRLNRQSVMRDNVRAYNEYLNKLTATRQGQNQLRISNINNLISGLTGSVNNILGTIESRRATNNTLRAIAAANPNVDARLIGGFDYYIDPITKRKYNKNQQYIGTING